ncbi:hypothetical protein EW146_g634 [Bondarzewia mesenterica]|uniref:Uncharacterized protein n=1 Tax=Bondarzewia mesenterica TaxID=1095465 RepID=A0A4S4M8A1_9AGAM|nr:hypothetical protein EW146_g634 [Bondarzewia mesenterica]
MRSNRIRSISPRDALLVLLGAACMHIFSLFFSSFSSSSNIIFNTQLSSPVHDNPFYNIIHDPPIPPSEKTADSAAAVVPAPPSAPFQLTTKIDIDNAIPETIMVSHAPGWTIFRNLYVSGGTLFIVTSKPHTFPDIALMTSTGLPAQNTPESIQARMPTAQDMSFISPEEARRRWAGETLLGQKNRIFPVEGATFLFNDPNQFLNHYYHFCAELLFGAWAFWMGSFRAQVDTHGVHDAPPVARMIFAHATAAEWRDGPGFNAYFLRAAFPSVTVETQHDWIDRATITPKSPHAERAWWFDRVLLADRSAAFRGEECGSRTQRTASEPMAAVDVPRGWWEPVRRNVLRFAGVDEGTLDIGVRADVRKEGGRVQEEVVVTYVSRQGVRRHLVEEDHEGLVSALEEVLIGVHGNGLTHLIMMPITPVSTVIEIFFPGGFAHDYEWTARARGMKHFSVWNDTSHTHPDAQWPNYPEGFQLTQIPVHGPYVAKLVEDRVDGRLP